MNVEWNNALEWAASFVEHSIVDGNGKETADFARNLAMSIRANKRELEGVEGDFVHWCGGWYCSEENGHIDCRSLTRDAHDA